MDRLTQLLNAGIILWSGMTFAFANNIHSSVLMATASTTTNNTQYNNHSYDLINDSTDSDDAIHFGVQSALDHYAMRVRVRVINRIVYLSGEVDSNMDYEKVVAIAESIKGVRDVNVDNLLVKSQKIPLNDIYITAKVKGAILRSDVLGKDTSSWSVTVETRDGKIYLSGHVPSAKEKQVILDIVRSIAQATNLSFDVRISIDTSHEE